MPYYFAASHWNYARDGLNYTRMMKKLPLKAFDSFLEGQHVLHLTDGIFNGIWSDMGIETTYMKHGKGPSGIIGITTMKEQFEYGLMDTICVEQYSMG